MDTLANPVPATDSVASAPIPDAGLSESPGINELAGALAKAQGAFSNPAKDRQNPHFHSRYATLDAVIEATRGPLFNDVNGGKVRVLIGSSETMGTGVNAQQRLAALHHLDVPWLPSAIEQREGRIERQGNQNAEIELYAYATLGSVDATQWQLLERKARFIAAALAGDRSIRRLEDVGAQANQFAMAKALASGDPRLMQKAGLEMEIARLRRLRAAHIDDQHAVRRTLAEAHAQTASSRKRCEQIGADLVLRTPTRGDLFSMEARTNELGFWYA